MTSPTSRCSCSASPPAIAAVGGAMFTLQVGFMSPSFVGIVPSIEMVIFCAVGGRHSLVGAVVGTLLVNWGKTLFSESFPELWLFAMGGLFIAVVLAFPRGLAGLVTDQIVPLLGQLRGARPRSQPRAAAPAPAPPNRETTPCRTPAPTSCSRSKTSRFRSTASRPSMTLNLYIDKNELRVIIGPNGAGKTTVLDLICGRTKVSERLDQVQGPGDHRPQGARDRAPRHRPQVPDAVDLRRPHGVREPGNLGAARPQCRRRPVLEAHRRR